MIITRKGVETKINGPKVKIGDMMPEFKAKNRDNEVVHSQEFKGKSLLISVYPDINTSTCDRQTRTFFQRAAEIDAVKIINISNNSVEELNNWCATNGLDVDMLSDHEQSFEKAFGLYMPDFKRLARSVFVIDQKGKIKYMEIVEDMAIDPDYDQAIQAALQ